MGAVYAAQDPDLDRNVALKLLRSEGLSEEARQRMRARLLREAKAMARLSHPEVITLYDVGTFGDQLFVAMEHIDGGTLRQWRAARHRTYAEILEVYERAGSGLAAAHEAGLVHRDFKPDNVLVGRDGRVRVTDFGLARVVDARPPQPPGRGDGAGGRDEGVLLTRTGSLLGTPAYMAPEQLWGRPADARSDVFSFCVALYEALHGERPFAGRSVLDLRSAIELGQLRARPVMTRVPPWVHAVLRRGLRAAADERFPTMRELLDALRSGYTSHRRRIRLFLASVFSLGLAVVATMLVRSREVVAETAQETPQASPVEDHLTTAVLSPRLEGRRPTADQASPAPSRDLHHEARHGHGSPLVGHNGAFILE
jgi:serine/threonine protein kinase